MALPVKCTGWNSIARILAQSYYELNKIGSTNLEIQLPFKKCSSLNKYF